jgi:redox-sensitive bicupin YhaK (pirin superfamily)
MSGPVDPTDIEAGDDPLARVEVRQGRGTTVGGLDIIRVLPTKGRRTVGPWCFVDCMAPPDFDEPEPMEVGPHPHIGLSTVTWLFEGEALHGDSLGTEQPIRPGQLNLMTAGHGIAHAELGLVDRIQGVQMWLAQPEETRHGESRFEHHGDLPIVDLGGGTATVILGAAAGVASPARVDSDLVGIDLSMGAGSVELETDRRFEYAVVPIDTPILVGPEVVEPGWLALVPGGLEALPIEARSDARMMVLGGVPLEDRIQMWWNFVARSKDELTEAWRDWQAGNTDRFGPVPSKLARIDAPPPPWLRSGG